MDNSIDHENGQTQFNLEKLYERWAKQDIQKRAAESKRKIDELADVEDFENKLLKFEQERIRQREEYYRNKAEKQGVAKDSLVSATESDSITIYKAKAALAKAEKKSRHKEGVFRRTVRLIKGLHAANKEIKAQPYITNEKKAALRRAVFEDAYAPICNAWEDAVDTLWEFICTVSGDLLEILLFIVDVFITAAYYLGSVAYWIWDIVWDIRLWFEERKGKVFQIFAGSVTAVAIILILVSSLTAFEYSYYGRTLGLARSKQEVYNTIDALGEKLSEATGANININVERDIEFKRIFGFNLDVDSADDILNTLTYMKDLQVRAFAININGERSVILESEDVAIDVINRIRNDYAGPKTGVEYQAISYGEEVGVEEVGVLLGDIWSPDDAVKYLETGSVKEIDSADYKPLITLYSTEIATYLQNVSFGYTYIDNSSIYADETEIISAGILGKDEVVAEVSRINGVEISRTVKSKTRISNPVNAVYYQGTKPIPEKIGTGTFIVPLKSYTLTSRFGGRNTGLAGASTYHEGVDMGAATGTKIYASDGGTVTYAGWRTGYGYVIIIDHGGLYESRYGHCSKLLVKTGDKVYQGQNIGLVGNSGVSYGSHLHFEIRYKGVAYNPLEYLP